MLKPHRETKTVERKDWKEDTQAKHQIKDRPNILVDEKRPQMCMLGLRTVESGLWTQDRGTKDRIRDHGQMQRPLTQKRGSTEDCGPNTGP
ncbi:hypothetical protein ACROYT_G043537 [Oculina patagonica]